MLQNYTPWPSQFALWRCARGVSWWLVMYTFWRRGNGKHRWICYHKGSQNMECLGCLVHLHGIIIGIKSLKRLTKTMRIFRKINHIELLEFAAYILQQCDGSGQLYWCISLDSGEMRCKWFTGEPKVNSNPPNHWTWGFQIRAARRLRRRVYRCAGPNAVWYIDGYDEKSHVA